jgi:hypothetical protein
MSKRTNGTGSDGIDGAWSLPYEQPPPPLGAALESELAALRPVRPRRPLRDAAILLVTGLAFAAAMLAMFEVRRDLLELPISWLVLMGAAWLLGFVVPAWLVVVPPPGQVIARWRAAAIAGGLSAVLFLMCSFVIQPSGPSSVPSLQSHLHNFSCLKVGLIAAIVPILLAAIAVRGSFPVGSRWAAAAIGSAGGALGGMMLHFHCPVTDPMHISVMHGGVVVVAALISALVVPRATDASFR